MKRRGVFALLLALALFVTACGQPRQALPTEPADTLPQETETAAPAEPELPQVADLDDGMMKILCIGNSFTVDTVEYVRHMASSAGYTDLLLGKLVVGGATLDSHLSTAQIDGASYEFGRSTADGGWYTVYRQTMAGVLQSENWDCVVLQQNSSYAGRSAGYFSLNPLLKIITSHIHPDAKVVFNMTWAYQQDCTFSEFQYYDWDQAGMYNAIVETVQSKVAVHEDIDLVLSTCSAVQNARTSWVGDTLTLDGYHLSRDRGRYMAAMAFCKTVLGIDLNEVTYRPAGVSEAFRQVAVEAAENAHAAPYAITPSAFTEAAGKEDSRQTLPFAQLAGTENGENGLRFYYTADGVTLTPYTRYDSNQGRWFDNADGQLNMIDPAEDLDANYGLSQCSGSKWVVMGYTAPETGSLDLFSLTTVSGPEGTYSYTVQIAKGTPDNILAEYTFSGIPGTSQEERYTLDVQAGEEIYLIYRILEGADLGGWFGYRNTVTYRIP